MSDFWRFISYEEHAAAYNMAADEAILDAHLAGFSPPTLRIYGFNPPALSLGANQKLTPTILQRVRAAGFDIVRRPTGGRAVLHLGDLTYSFVGTAAINSDQIDQKHFLSPNVNEAYRQICHGLILAFKRLGLELGFSEKSANLSRANPRPATANTRPVISGLQDCFAVTAGGDLHINGLKVVGSAQLRRKAAVLQHGTIILRQDQALVQELLQDMEITAKPPQVVRHANLYDLLSMVPSKQELGTLILQGFQDAFGITFSGGYLSELEQSNACRLSKTDKFIQCS